jgi:hypothetical protein
MGACLAREEERNQDGEEHHVAGQSREEKESDFVKQFARATAFMLPVVVAPTPTSACRSTV